MSNDWHRLREVFDSAKDLGGAAREECLAAACAGDAGLRDRVEALLRRHRASGTVLDKPAVEDLEGVLSAAEIPAEPDYTGVRLEGRYLLQARLDPSGFSTVYRARDERLGRDVAIKILREAGLSREFLDKELRREIEALARIDHQGVVGLLDYGEGPEGRPFLVLRMVRGETLRAVIGAGPLPAARAAALLRGLGEALEAAHQQGVFHRDLKPENIMLRGSGEPDEKPVILDFGVAAVREPGNAGGASLQLAGSPDYMAPEQPASASAASDIYALGLIAFEMLAGRHVKSVDRRFGGVAGEIARNALAELHPEVSPAARELLASSLAFDPRERPAGARLFGERMAAALSPAPTLPRRRAILSYSAAAAALAAGAVAWWSWNRGTPAAVEIGYQLTALRAGESAPAPFLPAADLRFHAGDGVRFTAHGRQAGYLYLFNESRPADGSPAHLNLLVPGGSVRVPADGAVQVPGTAEDWIRFDVRPATERLWIVWTPERITDLDAVAGAADDRGSVAEGPSRDGLRAFLARHADPPPAAATDARARRVVLRAAAPPLVYSIDFRHE